MPTRYIRKHPYRNRYEIEDDGNAVLTVVRNDGTEERVLLDAADVPALKRRQWMIQTNVDPSSGTVWNYVRTARGGTIGHVLLDVPPGQRVTYANHDGMDCRRANLRVASLSEIKSADRQVYRSNTGERHISKIGDRQYRVTIGKGNEYQATRSTLAAAIVARDAWIAREQDDK